jgi:hypothetical protein
MTGCVRFLAVSKFRRKASRTLSIVFELLGIDGHMNSTAGFLFPGRTAIPGEIRLVGGDDSFDSSHHGEK